MYTMYTLYSKQNAYFEISDIPAGIFSLHDGVD